MPENVVEATYLFNQGKYTKRYAGPEEERHLKLGDVVSLRTSIMVEDWSPDINWLIVGMSFNDQGHLVAQATDGIRRTTFYPDMDDLRLISRL